MLVFVVMMMLLAAAQFSPLKTLAYQGSGIYLPSNQFGGRCLDGSSPIYWINSGVDDGANKWILFYEGGGLCDGLNGGSNNCYNYSTNYFGGYYGSSLASSGVPAMYNFSESYGNYLSQDASVNPQMYNWNMVYMHYCDGGLWTGGLHTPVSVYDGLSQIYFTGNLISQAILQDLLENRGLALATDVVVAGSSAGGVAVYNKVDQVRDIITQQAQSSSGTTTLRVVALADSGFMLAYDTSFCQFKSQLQWIFLNMNASSALSEECLQSYASDGAAAAGDSGSNQYLCMFPQYNVPFTQSPLFALQSRFDSYQYLFILCTYSAENSYADELNQTAIESYSSLLDQTYYGAGMGLGNKGGIMDNCPHHFIIYNTTFLQYFDPWNSILGTATLNWPTNATITNATTFVGADADTDASVALAMTQQEAFRFWYENGTTVQDVVSSAQFVQAPVPPELSFSYCHNADAFVLGTNSSNDNDNSGLSAQEQAVLVGVLVPLLALGFYFMLFFPRRHWQSFCEGK